MFFQKTLATILVGGLLFGNLLSQSDLAAKPRQPEISPELQKNAVEFLRQTIKEIPNLKSAENRQYFKIETARLLLKYDPKESRRMLEEAAGEVKQLMAKLADDYQKTVAEIKKARASSIYGYPSNVNAINATGNYRRPANYRSNSPYANAANRPVEDSDTLIYQTGQMWRVRKISNLRRRLIENLAEAEPILAYQFLIETNKILPKEIESYNYIETYNPPERMIIAKMLEKNEVDKSVELARKMLDENFTEGFLSILTMIYEKDSVKGSRLADEVLQTLKTPNGVKMSNYGELSTFLSRAVESSGQNPPMLNEKSLRELAKLLGQKILAEMSDNDYYFTPYIYAKQIEKHAPREALQILQKAKQRRYNNANRPLVNAPYENRVYAVNTKANYPVNYAANKMVNKPAMNVSAQSKNSNSIPTPTPSVVEIPPTSDEWTLTTDTKAELLQKLRDGKFTADERKKIVEAAKQYAIETNHWSYARADRFASIVRELAMFSLISADPEVSDDLMKEAETFVRPQTKNVVDYVSKALLAVGYSSHRPNKSFALMESLTSINEVIDGAVKLGEFIDTETEMIENGEVSAVMFLGEERFMRDFFRLGELSIFIQNLAKADFKRTRELADKFEKTEVKMTARMLILESLLGETPEADLYRGGGIDY